MVSVASLRSTLAVVVQTSLTAGTVWLSGCDGSVLGSGRISRDGFGDAPTDLDTLRVSAGLDYLAFIEWNAEGPSPAPREYGTVCETAKDLPTCKQRVAEATAKGGFGFSHGTGQLGSFVTTKGDDVREIGNTKELLEVVGPVDSPTEAYVLLTKMGYRITGDRWVRATQSGYELIGKIETRACDPIVEEEHRVEVRRDGAVTVLERVETLRKNSCYGRRPARYRDASQLTSSTLGGFFARAAELEAASVHAFDILRDELRHHGAPERLLRAAERAE